MSSHIYNASNIRDLSELTHSGRDKMAVIFQTTFWKGFSWMKNLYISIKISLKFVPINNIPASVQIKDWRRPGDNPYLNQWWRVYWRIYVSLDLSELNQPPTPSRHNASSVVDVPLCRMFHGAVNTQRLGCLHAREAHMYVITAISFAAADRLLACESRAIKGQNNCLNQPEIGLTWYISDVLWIICRFIMVIVILGYTLTWNLYTYTMELYPIADTI